MKFICKNPNTTYVVRPTYREIINGSPVNRWGLKVTFTQGGIFDSMAAQRSGRWTDEEREQVEEFLLMHPDLGRFYFPAPTETEEEIRQYGNVGVAEQFKRCIGILDTPEGAEPCGRPVVEGTDYCSVHLPAGVVG